MGIVLARKGIALLHRWLDLPGVNSSPILRPRADATEEVIAAKEKAAGVNINKNVPLMRDFLFPLRLRQYFLVHTDVFCIGLRHCQLQAFIGKRNSAGPVTHF